MSDDERRIAEITSLLAKPGPDRYARAQALADELLDRPPAVVLDLVLKLIDAEAIGTTIGLDLVSFVDEADLATVARRCLQRQSDGRTQCLQQIAVQDPRAVPRSVVDGLPDFQMWRDDPKPAFAPMHLIFEHGAQSQDAGAKRATRDRHPTWALPTQPPSFRFGGEGVTRCPSCGQAEIHLLTLDREIAGFAQTSQRLVIETCPTCWSDAYYRHDDNGTPVRIDPIVVEGKRWKSVPLQEQKVRLAATPRRWVHQTWATSNGRQNMSRLGGVPSWVQDNRVPQVPGTLRKMTLLLQIDSYYPTVDGGRMLWGSGGALYVFWDAETRTSCQFGQWT